MFSFSIEDNEIIRNFLNGDDTDIPTSQILYLHSRPLLRPNFITQIEDLVNKVAIKIGKANLSGKPIQDLEKFAIQLGVAMGKDMTESTAKEVAIALRNIYNLCNDLDKKL